MTTYRHTFTGDSLTAQTADGVTSLAQGGSGGWIDLTRLYLEKTLGIGPLVSSGLSMVCRGVFPYGATEWTKTGTWTATASTDAWDKAPMGLGFYGANGTANVVTYKHPRGLPSMVGFYVDWINYTGVGGINWSYRINSGAWTNHGQIANPIGDNSYNRFYVSATIAVGDTIEFRQASETSSSQKCFIVGIHPFYLAPGSAGLYIQNISAGGMTLHNTVLSGSGDRMAWIDSVVLGTGSPLAEKPDSLTGMNLNDLSLINNTTTWGNDIDTLQSRCHTNGVLFGFMNQYETDYSLNTSTVQSNYRSTTKSKCAAHTPVSPVLDFYDELVKLGMGASGIQGDRLFNSGLIIPGTNNVHQGPFLQKLMARFAHKFIMDNFFSSISEVPKWSPGKAADATVINSFRAAPSLAAGPHRARVPEVLV